MPRARAGEGLRRRRKIRPGPIRTVTNAVRPSSRSAAGKVVVRHTKSRRGPEQSIAEKQAAFEQRVLALALQSPGKRILGVLAATIAHRIGKGKKWEIEQAKAALQKLSSKGRIKLAKKK